MFLVIRAPLELEARAERLALRPAAALLGAAVLAGLLVVPGDAAVVVPFLLLGFAGTGALLAAGQALKHRHRGVALACTAFAAASPALLVGVRLAADIVPAAADRASLVAIGWVVAVIMPVLVTAQVWMWWVFRDRVDARTAVFF